MQLICLLSLSWQQTRDRGTSGPPFSGTRTMSLAHAEQASLVKITQDRQADSREGKTLHKLVA